MAGRARTKALTECPHCHDTQTVAGKEGGPDTSCACTDVAYRLRIGLSVTER